MNKFPASLCRVLCLSVLVLLPVVAGGQEQRRASAAGERRAARTFANPLLSAGADPWSIYHDGFYYYMHTTGKNLTIWKTRSIADLKDAERRIVWTPPATGAYSKDIWAPELHRIDNKWYIYFAADAGRNQSHRLWVLETDAADPLRGEWMMKGKLADASDKWAIDGSVFEHKGRRYLVWSGWEGDENAAQHIYIARLKNPWTIEGERVRLSTPEYPWEKVGDILDWRTSDNPPHVDVNEGPQFLSHKDKVFLIYSASGCWTESYTLGMLTANADADLLDRRSWRKTTHPVFGSRVDVGAHAPGHNSFFKSPDGTEDWILYHANPKAGQGCGARRNPRAQPFTWRADGTPDFGSPVPIGKAIPRPSGERDASAARSHSNKSRILLAHRARQRAWRWRRQRQGKAAATARRRGMRQSSAREASIPAGTNNSPELGSIRPFCSSSMPVACV